MKKRIYLTLIIALFLIFLIVVFVIFPLFYKIKGSSENLVLQKEKFAELEMKIANLEKFKVLYADLQHLLREIDNLFIDSNVPIEFISFLEETSERCQLEIEIFSVSDKKLEKNFRPYLIFQLASSGTFPDFLKFLEKIENGPYLVELQGITISKLEENREFISDKIKATFSIKVFAK